MVFDGFFARNDVLEWLVGHWLVIKLGNSLYV